MYRRLPSRRQVTEVFLKESEHLVLKSVDDGAPHIAEQRECSRMLLHSESCQATRTRKTPTIHAVTCGKQSKSEPIRR